MNKLVLFTDGYPFDEGEKPFIHNELYVLSKEYDITIVAYTRKQFADKDITIDLPANVTAKKYIIDDIGRKDILKRIPATVFSKAYKNEMSYISKLENKKAMKQEALEYITRAKLLEEWIVSNIDIDGTDVFYTYWNSYATLALAMIKESKPELKFVTRMHGYDLYDERTRFGRQYYKSYIDEKVNKICFISEHGMDFYKGRYAGRNQKYEVCRIGVKAGANVPAGGSQSGEFTIVSCASVIPLKRVDMTVRALAQIDDISIKWIHIGNGSEFDKVKALCAELLDGKSNINYELKGFMDNKAVREFYDQEYIDFFITTSSTEGSPVSIQEALAYGMVIIGTDVGEVSRLAEGNGYVLTANPEVKEVAEGIRKMCNMSQEEMKSMRQHSYEKWQKYYDADVNAENFVKLLKAL